MSMRTVSLELRRRTSPNEEIEDVHRRVMKDMDSVPSAYWNGAQPTVPDIGDALSVDVDLSPCVPGAVNGHLSYVYRSPKYTGDRALYDDRMFLEFDVDSESYRSLVTSALPSYIMAFRPYYAEVVLDEDLAIRDWKEAVALGKEKGKDLGGRDGVWRIAPACYLDGELCRRSFALGLEEVIQRLEGKVEKIEKIHDGVFLLVTSALITFDDLLTVDARVRGWLDS